MDTLLNDIRYSLRLVRKNPSFAFIAIAAIALSIGANSAIFSVVSSVLLKPLPYQQADRLVRIWGKYENEGIPKNWISEPELIDLVQTCQSFENLAAYKAGGANLTGTGDPVRINTAAVNASLFPILGVSAMQGRVFLEEEDQPGRNKVVLVSSKLWRSRFAADPRVVGTSIGLNGENYTVLGIMPDGFQYPDRDDLWVPLAIDKAKPSNRGNHSLEVVGRLKSGVSSEQASAELNRVALMLQEQNPNNYPQTSGWGLFLVPMLDETVGDIKPALFVLLGAVLFVLLIACANIANLLLARSSAREKEIAVRASLGARRARLVRQLLTESIMLALTGGIIGVLLAYAGIKSFVAFGPRDIPRIEEISLDWRVLGFSLLLTLITGLVFGLAPALRISRPDLHDSLKEGARGSTGSRNRLRSVLVLAEVALALVLLVGAGLMLKSFAKLLDLNLGYRTDNILTMRISLPSNKYKEDKQVASFYDQLLDKVKGLPGVTGAGAISHLPLSGSYTSGSVAVEDQAAGQGLPLFVGYPYIETDQRTASVDYFNTLGIQLIKGRLFTDADNSTAPKVAIVDESFERRFWPNSTALGQHVSVGFDQATQKIQWGEIVGVVGHINHYGVDQVKQYQLKFEGREQLYVPIDQRPDQRMYLAVRTSVEPTGLVGAVRSQVLSLDPEQPAYDIRTMDDRLSDSVSQRRLNMLLMAGFSTIALVLAVVGIYGVLSYSVTQRTHEIGIRMALGAQQRGVLALVVRQGMKLVVIGLAMGSLAALMLTRLMQGLLFGVSATDPPTFITISLTLSVVALLACLIPARRASRVDPMVALRYE
jgi:putative ABC transport system permease protein